MRPTPPGNPRSEMISRAPSGARPRAGLNLTALQAAVTDTSVQPRAGRRMSVRESGLNRRRRGAGFRPTRTPYPVALRSMTRPTISSNTTTSGRCPTERTINQLQMPSEMRIAEVNAVPPIRVRRPNECCHNGTTTSEDTVDISHQLSGQHGPPVNFPI
jgi:hypothetical protein